MVVSWDEYESHIGHKTYNGCFRCHDDNHKSEDGKVISIDCNICHTIVAQGEPGFEELATIKDALEFIHPKELEDGCKPPAGRPRASGDTADLPAAPVMLAGGAALRRAAAATRLAADPAQRNRLGAGARDSSKAYYLPDVAREYMALFRQVIASRTSR